MAGDSASLHCVTTLRGDVTEANLLTQWARLLLGSLADAGVRHVVLSPGSRSTPLMIAAERDSRLVCHDSIDERAAAFFALGQARVTGEPSLVISTSGTAPAHYLPAVVEASLSYLPLVVLTADRPLELQDCGASQTTDQIKLMGDHVRRFYELGSPDPAPSALAGVRRLAAQAVHFSRFPVPGPVHLNARARKPLEPQAATTGDERDLEARVAGLLSRPVARASLPTADPDPDGIRALAERCRSVERGLIVCGPAPADHVALRPAVRELAASTGFPLLAEATSQLRFDAASTPGLTRCDAFDALLRSPHFQATHRPELVVQVGAAPVSSGFEQYLAAHDGVDRVVIAPHGWQDAGGATALILGDPQRALRGVLSALDARRPGPSPWAQLFAGADRLAWEVVEAEMDGGDLTEGRAVRTVVEGLPTGSLLMVGNSLAVREVDTFCPAGTADVTVLSQRGASGIDGLVAGASGGASVQGQPVTLLLGDISLLHDLTGLALAADAAVALAVVVLNNGGGRIFEQLPFATAPSVPAGAMDHVTTPHRFELEHAALLFGHRYAAARTAEELAKALEAALGEPGCTLIEVPLPPHGAAEQHGRLFAKVDAAVRSRSTDTGEEGVGIGAV